MRLWKKARSVGMRESLTRGRSSTMSFYGLFTLKTAYKEFEERVGQMKSPRGTKTEQVKSVINSFSGEFTLTELERTCPGVSKDMIRRVLRECQGMKQVECLGRGPGALWSKRGSTPKRG